MIDERQNDPNNRDAFPDSQGREYPWKATELERGPFERRRGLDRRAPDLSSEEDTGASDESVSTRGGRRRWGRRKTDVLSVGGQSMARRLREPIIGLTLAGMAVPLINAGLSPEQTEKAAGTEDAETAAPDAAERDLDEAVGDVWAEAEADVVRAQTIEGAMTRWSIDAALAEKIYDYATKHDIEPDMAYGLVFTESTFRERAVSHVGARGLTQLMPRTAQWLDPGVSVRDLFDPDVNLDLGFRYLRQLIEKYDGDVQKALTAYNRGPGTVDRILGVGGNPDNGYAGKVLAG